MYPFLGCNFAATQWFLDRVDYCRKGTTHVKGFSSDSDSVGAALFYPFQSVVQQGGLFQILLNILVVGIDRCDFFP